MKDENILCVTKNDLKRFFDTEKRYWTVKKETVNLLPFFFERRMKAENHVGNKQIIPYAMIFNSEGKLLVYQRHGSESRLRDFYSVGIGGHVNEKDKVDTLSKTLLRGVKREIREEIGLDVTDSDIQLIGMIDEEQTEVGLYHTGIVFSIKTDNQMLHFDSEINNPQWRVPGELDLSCFELWSSLALQLYESYRDEKRNNQQNK